MRDNRAAACCPLETVSTGHFESSQQLHARPNVIMSPKTIRAGWPSPRLSSPPRRVVLSTANLLFPIYSRRATESSRKREHAVPIMRSVTPLSTVANRVSSNTSRVPTSLSLSPHGQIRIVAPITRNLFHAVNQVQIEKFIY